MTQMRRDIFTDRWVIVEQNERVQPGDFVSRNSRTTRASAHSVRATRARRPRKSSLSEIEGLLLTVQDGRFEWCPIPNRG